ncbi:MAG: class I SAM-dependent methyltransferase, partial [Chitinophagaceae bacterium]
MDYLKINKNLWNTRVNSHVDSAFYQLAKWKNGRTSLTEIELALLGDLRNKKVLHLQCHFGQDTLSLARMGALPTGLDFSEKAIKKAQELTEELQLDATFICGNVYDTRKLYEGFADIIFTSYGVIGWLPELNTWAQNIADCLKPGGRLVFVEFHPFIWTFDNAFSRIEYSY